MPSIPFLSVALAELPADFPAIQTIRQQVFQQEQGVAPDLEFDGNDAAATHWLAYLDSQPVGTARMRSLSAQVAKIERVAVLKQYRGIGIGQKLMEAVLSKLVKIGISEVQIHAQTQVQQFYDRLGFVPQGEIFAEAGIPHVKMRLLLSQPD
ncbi:MAG TPA: GNAT family N-acetyltransferase [Thermosynechococcaceae cyanobacterium]